MAAPENPPRAAGAPAAAGTTVLAFDFGEKRIGVAVGDLTLRIAHPLLTIAAENNTTRFAEIGALIAEWRPTKLVVGLPMHADGTEHRVSRLARRFGNRLEGRFGVAVTLVDERLTSRAAESRMREAGVRADRIKASLDVRQRARSSSSILRSCRIQLRAPHAMERRAFQGVASFKDGGQMW